MPWVESFSYLFRYPQHIHLLEVEALISHIRGLLDRGLGNRRVLCLVDSRVVLGSVCKERSSSRRVNFRLRRLGGLLFANNLSLDLCVGYPLGQIPATHHLVFTQSASGGPLSRCFLDSCTSLHELFFEAQVEVDRLLEPLSKGARASLQRLREKQGIAFIVDSESSERPSSTRT